MVGIRWGVGVGGVGGVPFLSIIIRLLTLACRCLHGLGISGATLDDAEHSLADLDFRDQLARRLFCVRYVQRPFLSRSRPVAYLVVVRHSFLPPRSR